MTDEDVRRISVGAEELAAATSTTSRPSFSSIGGVDMWGMLSMPGYNNQQEQSSSTFRSSEGKASSLSSSSPDEDLHKIEGSIADLSLDAEDPDRYNAQMVSVYINDIMEYLKESEVRRQPSANYMSRQTDINAKMREILIDWLVEVHLKFKLKQETLYLTVNIIDRFLERRAVSRNKLQLVGCAAMLIASKYEEIYAPEVQDFVYVSDKAYTREQILAMETIILNALEFNLTVPYATRFAERYVRLASDSDQFKEMVNYLIELTLQEYRFLKYLPSMIASSAVSLALHLSGNPSWTQALERCTKYSEADIRGCVMDLWLHAAKDSPKYRAVRKKYTSSKFHGVARITIDPPAEQ